MYRKRSQREIEILRQLIHPNIVEYKGSAIINGRLAFVTEYIEVCPHRQSLLPACQRNCASRALCRSAQGGNLLEANSNGGICWDPR